MRQVPGLPSGPFPCNLGNTAKGGSVRTHVLKTLAVAFVVAATFLAQAESASAQTAPTPITHDGKKVDGEIAGIVGLGFLGLDLGLLIPPMVGLHDHGWAYGVFPAVLAGAGVGAGIAVTDSLDPGVNIAFLGVGLGLFVPALVGTLAWRSNKMDRELQVRNSAVLRLGAVNLHPPSVANPLLLAGEKPWRTSPSSQSGKWSGRLLR